MSLCECGCGGLAPIAKRTDSAKGWVKGEPLRFILGHSAKLGRPPEYLVDERTGCWVWQRAKDRHGYGSIGRRECARRGAHAHFYELAHGPVPPGLVLDHLCRNPSCVNPAHLEPVTHAENMRRGKNAKLTADDVLAIRASAEPHRVLAERYGVAKGTIGNVRSWQCWDGVGEKAA